MHVYVRLCVCAFFAAGVIYFVSRHSRSLRQPVCPQVPIFRPTHLALLAERLQRIRTQGQAAPQTPRRDTLARSAGRRRSPRSADSFRSVRGPVCSFYQVSGSAGLSPNEALLGWPAAFRKRGADRRCGKGARARRRGSASANTVTTVRGASCRACGTFATSVLAPRSEVVDGIGVLQLGIAVDPSPPRRAHVDALMPVLPHPRSQRRSRGSHHAARTALAHRLSRHVSYLLSRMMTLLLSPMCRR